MSERKSSDATEGRSEGDTVFVVAKEAIIDVPGEPKRVGYTVNPAFPTFGAWDDAAAFVKQKNLPLGWVIVEPKQLNLSVGTDCMSDTPRTDEAELSAPGISTTSSAGAIGRRAAFVRATT